MWKKYPEMTEVWQKLIERYADGQIICNCKQAYYINPRFVDTDPNPKYHYWLGNCQYGCQANQYQVRDYIAKKVLDELEKLLNPSHT